MEDGRGRRLEEQLQERPPESSVHPPRADRTWSLVSAPGSRHRVAGHAANMASRICTWGGVHRTVLRAQPFPVGLQGGGGLSAPLSVQEKGEQRSPSTQEWGPRAPALTSPQGAPRPTSPGPEAISPDCSTPGPLKYAPRLHLRSLYTLWRSGLRAGDQPRRGAASAWRARPSPPVSLSCALACPACSRHAGLWVLWPLAGLLVLGPRSQPPEGGWGSPGDSTGKNRPLALVLTPHLENGDSVLAARSFRGPLPPNSQHTPTVWGPGPEPVPPSPRPVAGLPRPPLPTAASQPGRAAAIQKPALQTQTSLLTFQAPSCLPRGQWTQKSPSPHRREQIRLPLNLNRRGSGRPCVYLHVAPGRLHPRGLFSTKGCSGLEGRAWSQEPTLLGLWLPGPQGHLGPCIPTTRQVQAGRPCRSRQRARRGVFNGTSL